MPLRHLDDRDPDPVRIADPHLDESPRLLAGLARDLHPGAAQLLVRRRRVGDLEPDAERGRRGFGGTARDLQEAVAQEVDDAALLARAELPVHGEAELAAVEIAGAVGVRGAQQNPAAQYLHHVHRG
ncbi:hypothetical protein STTU_3147 [Streptomyces sp. Tu6071]|nr:hypothetical protein STTU_3147 [Streptomyces sp. Tu6071]